MSETTYYYIKYWESSGILAIKSDFEPSHSGSVHVRGDYKDKPSYLLWINKAAFLTVEEARAAIAPKLKSAITSAEKKLAKLKAIDLSKLEVTVTEYR